MNAIRTAGVVVAAGLLVGCQHKNEKPRAAAPEPAPIQAAESLRQSLVRANPDARVGIVAATVGRFAAVREVPAGNVAEGATVQILDPGGDVIGYGLVRAVKNDMIHVLYQADTRRGPAIGDLVMPATDAGVPIEEMPAGAGMEPAAESTEPSLLPPRRQAAQPDAAPAEAAPAEQPVAQPQEPAPTLKEETQPGDFQPAPGGNRAKLPPVEGATDAAAPAPGATEPAEPTEPTEPAPKPAAEPSPGDTNNTAGDAAPAPAEPAPEAPAKEAPAKEAPAPAPEAAKEPAPAPAAEEKAPEADKPGLNK